MERSRCMKSNRFALIVVICGLLSLVYGTQYYIHFSKSWSVDKIRRSVPQVSTKENTQFPETATIKYTIQTQHQHTNITLEKQQQTTQTSPPSSTVTRTSPSSTITRTSPSSTSTITQTSPSSTSTMNRTSQKPTTTTQVLTTTPTTRAPTSTFTTAVQSTTKPTSTKNVSESRPAKADTGSKRGSQLLVVKFDANYPPYVKPSVLREMSFYELKSASNKYNFQKPNVARVIHQSWKTAILPPRFVKWSNTWKQNFPEWEYKLWTDADNLRLVKLYFPWFLPRYNRLTLNVQKADAVRYLYLFAHGGIYADLDDECLKPFEHVIKNDVIAFGAMSGAWYPQGHLAHVNEGYVQNSFMYSVPGHPFWLDVIETIMKKPPSSSPEGTTGPFMLQEVINRWRQKNPRRKEEMHIYEPHYFNPFSWIARKYPECKDVNRMTSRDIMLCKAHFKDSYVIQYHTQTWGRGSVNTNRNDKRRL